MPSSTSDMTRHLLAQTLPAEEARLAAYYERGMVDQTDLSQDRQELRAMLHASDWLGGQVEPDLKILATYANIPDTHLSTDDIYDKLTSDLERAIHQTELRMAGEVIGLTLGQREMYGLSRSDPVPKYLRGLSIEDLQQRLDKIEATWWDLDTAAA